MFDPRLPRIPRKGRSRTCLVRHRLKIDKLVVSSCSGGEINRRDGLTRAWNHFRGPFCPNRSNQDQNRVPIPRILSKFGFEEDKSVSLPLLSYPCRILESFARIIDRVGETKMLGIENRTSSVKILQETSVSRHYLK